MIGIALIKSPLNYTGGKYKLLPTILPVFAECSGVTRFIDLFCGGLNVGINVPYPEVIANDTLAQVMELYGVWQRRSVEDVVAAIEARVVQYSLSKVNQDGYLALRAAYNASPTKDPLDFFTLVCYSFNNQIRFNRRGEFNLPFGLNRSSFNPAIRANLVTFVGALQGKRVQLDILDFAAAVEKHLGEGEQAARTLVYSDSPYLISTATYNESGGWTEIEERRLYETMDLVHARGARFVLSNLMSQGDRENVLLREWAKGYHVRALDYTYANCSYHKKAALKRGKEVLVTNW